MTAPAKPAGERLVVALVRGLHGLRGAVRVEVLTDHPEERFAAGAVDLVHEGYRNFLQLVQAYTPKEIYRLGAESEMNGGNVFDTYTGPELTQANDRWADLLCFRLIPIETETGEDNAEYFNLDQLRGLEGHCWVIQNRIDISNEDGRYHCIYPEQAHLITLKLLSGPMSHLLAPGRNFVLEANRQASMLFDADPKSTVFMPDVLLHELIPGSRICHGVSVCLQRINLANIVFDAALHDIVTTVFGRWTGTVYARDFDLPDNKPYAFLGRHRVLVKRASPLYEHLQELKDSGRLSRIAMLIHDLTEVDAGYTPQSVVRFL